MEVLTPHSLYIALGSGDSARRRSYRDLFRCKVGCELLEDIRRSANKGLVLGNDRFVDQVEALTG